MLNPQKECITMLVMLFHIKSSQQHSHCKCPENTKTSDMEYNQINWSDLFKFGHISTEKQDYKPSLTSGIKMWVVKRNNVLIVSSSKIVLLVESCTIFPATLPVLIRLRWYLLRCQIKWEDWLGNYSSVLATMNYGMDTFILLTIRLLHTFVLQIIS